MNPLEKPSSAKRKKQELELRKVANSHRQKQRTLAILRDNGLCTACHFLDNKKVKAQDVHHVYGRAATKSVLTDKREHFSSLLCLCRHHHNKIGIIRSANSGTYLWVERLLKTANSNPINKDFDYEW